MSNNRMEIRPWSPEEEAHLRALIESGMTATEIGRQLGRTRLAVYGRLQRPVSQAETPRRSRSFPRAGVICDRREAKNEMLKLIAGAA